MGFLHRRKLLSRTYDETHLGFRHALAEVLVLYTLKSNGNSAAYSRHILRLLVTTDGVIYFYFMCRSKPFIHANKSFFEANRPF